MREFWLFQEKNYQKSTFDRNIKVGKTINLIPLHSNLPSIISPGQSYRRPRTTRQRRFIDSPEMIHLPIQHVIKSTETLSSSSPPKDFTFDQRTRNAQNEVSNSSQGVGVYHFSLKSSSSRRKRRALHPTSYLKTPVSHPHYSI